MLEISCGMVLVTRENGEERYLLIQNENGICGLPKGHMEAGETETETALREVWEETSIRPELIPGFREEIRYSMSNGNDKKVVFYLGRFSHQMPARNEGFEQFNFLLLPFHQAYDRLSFANTKGVLKRAEDFLRRKAGEDAQHETTHPMKLHERPFAMIAEGRKTIELRLNDQKRQLLRAGDTIVFSNSGDPERQIRAKVVKLHRFASFDDLYCKLPLEQCGYLPEELATASPKDMEAYYTPEEQALHGVVGIELELC